MINEIMIIMINMHARHSFDPFILIMIIIYFVMRPKIQCFTCILKEVRI